VCGTRRPGRRCASPTLGAGFTWVPQDVRDLYRTAWEIPQRGLIDMAAARTPFLDQSQSLNLFLETPTIGKLSSMYAYAWKQGLKTTYYLRSRPATRIARAAQAQTPIPVQQLTPTKTRWPAPWKTPSPARPASDDQRSQEPSRPGLRADPPPMRYPDFYERYRDAIKNTGPSRRSTSTRTSPTSRSCRRVSST